MGLAVARGKDGRYKAALKKRAKRSRRVRLVRKLLRALAFAANRAVFVPGKALWDLNTRVVTRIQLRLRALWGT